MRIFSYCFLILALFSINVVASVPITVGFDEFTTTSYHTSPVEVSASGHTFVLTATGGDAGYEFNSNASYPGELEMGSDGGGGTIKITITHKDDWVFDFTSFLLMRTINAPDWVLKGYRLGSEVSGSPHTFTLPQSTYQTVTTNFSQVDMVTLEEDPVYVGGFQIWADEFVVDNVTDPSLPVELSSFTTECRNKAVELNWSTESEKDNIGFILERRLAGELDWDIIATHETVQALRGHGTTSEKHNYSFTDANINSGDTYEYRLSDVDINGAIEIKKIVAITVEATPINFTLNQNYPNPFNPTTTIDFSLTETQNVKLTIYNMAGQLVETLIEGELNAGNHSTEWNAANVPAGTYFYQLQAGSHKEIKKAVLLK